jgi:hypothetical protein
MTLSEICIRATKGEFKHGDKFSRNEHGEDSYCIQLRGNGNGDRPHYFINEDDTTRAVFFTFRMLAYDDWELKRVPQVFEFESFTANISYGLERRLESNRVMSIEPASRLAFIIPEGITDNGKRYKVTAVEILEDVK